MNVVVATNHCASVEPGQHQCRQCHQVARIHTVRPLESEKDMVSFAKLAAPTREELSHILARVAVKTVAMVRHRA